MYIKEVHTTLNIIELYSLFQDKLYSFILDSSLNDNKLGQYSFIGFDPHLIIKSKKDKITLIQNEKERIYYGDPFEKLRELLNQYQEEYKTDLPFIGGFVGYLSYDLCHYIEKLPQTAIDDVNIPDMFFGLYDGIIIIDHVNEKKYIAALGIKDDEKVIIKAIEDHIKNKELAEKSISQKPSKSEINLKSNIEKEAYIKKVKKVKDYIKAGDIYQANLTQRFECTLPKSPYELYKDLRSINPSPFSSFIDFGEGYIVSSSPERFIQIKGNYIETRPIKGTRPRGNNQEEDIKNKEELINSEKDKAELLMIVDLERNDIGKIAKTGTVKVPDLFHLETYATVHHLVSTVVGEIKEEYDIIDCIKATFPGGSITGAPKIRAMEIIDELEPTQRNVYTGSIGYIGLNGDVDLNIVIRTIVCKDNKAYLQVGGAIVWDSDEDLEYEETLHKAKAMIKALEM
ncbi:aminodeoxychorismate synthase subunit I [Natranaerovirga hydrolytica]|uniref:Anthranilate synthase component 1 n=1 Tax=Natranaerovirga hydrolytica TaxID=680378 RepID=A0A4R1MRV3_9FIRM|nr:aminodeoxychorismate synthase component I [Natranaerovirga hydrolytica]TCK93299.1 aminodeoxychorismate synthase subunit I [Natranaerovirga hydrolytica]